MLAIPTKNLILLSMKTKKSTISEIEPQYKKFGELARVHREKMDLPQKEVADQLGISRVSLANIESGRQRVMLLEALGLANFLGFSIATLQDEFRGNRLEKKVLEQPKKIRDALQAVREQFRNEDSAL